MLPFRRDAHMCQREEGRTTKDHGQRPEAKSDEMYSQRFNHYQETLETSGLITRYEALRF